MTRAELHQMIEDLPSQALDGAAILVRAIHEGRIDPDQAWFWTPEWQAGEREIDEANSRGEHGKVYSSEEEFLASLEADLKPLDD